MLMTGLISTKERHQIKSYTALLYQALVLARTFNMDPFVFHFDLTYLPQAKHAKLYQKSMHIIRQALILEVSNNH